MNQRDTVLIVDDAEVNRVILGELFSHDYRVLEAENGLQALDMIHSFQNRIAVVLMDIVMPQMDGFQVMQAMGAEGILSSLPVVVITSENSSESEVRSFDLGASDIIMKPFENYVVKRRVQNIIDLSRHKNHLEDLVVEQSHKLQESNEIMIDALSSVIEHRSLESGQHIRRIRMFTKILLKQVAASYPEYCLDNKNIDIIASASSMHDIGKIAIPDSVLNKPGKLTDEEYEIMKTHSVKGCEILQSLGKMDNKQYLKYAYNICRYHHERWDGRGYPDNLRGDNIPFCAQVVSIADVYDALTTDRVYKAAFSHEKAVSMILGGECGAFNPKLIECFRIVELEFSALAKEYADGGDLHSELFPVPLELAQDSASDEKLLGHHKYFTMMKYLESTVIEINLDNGQHHIAYTPVSDFDLLRGNNSFEKDFKLFLRSCVHPEEQKRVSSELHDNIQSIYYEGASRFFIECRILHKTTGTYHWYRLALLRVDTDDPKQHRIILICSDIDSMKQSSQYDPDNQQFLYALRRSYFAVRLSDLTNNTCTEISSLDQGTPSLINQYEDLIQEEAQNKIHPDDQAFYYQQYSKKQMDAYFSRHLDRVVEYRRKGPGGRTIWIQSMDVRSSEAQNDALTVFSFLQDVTARKDWESNNHSSSGYPSDRDSLLQQFHYVFFEYNAKSRVLSFSPNYQERYGVPPPASIDALRKQAHDLVHPTDLDPYLEQLTLMELGKACPELEYRCRNSTGEFLWYKKNVIIYRNDDGTLERVCGMIADIDRYKRENALLEAKTQTDPLTGLYNKITVEAQIESLLNTSSDVSIHALFIVDLDNFKLTNDSYGHLMGDQLLKQIALKLTQQFRGEDLIGRIGGDEFVILMKNISSLENVERKASSLIRAIEEISIGSPHTYHFSASVGISLYPHDGTAYQELFHKADLALYNSKHAGKGQWHLYSNAWSPSSLPAFPKVNRIEGSLDPGASFNSQLLSAFCETEDEGEAVNAIIDMAARHFSLNHVFVLHSDGEHPQTKLFDWCADSAIQPYRKAPVLPEDELLEFQSYSDSNGVFCCCDARTAPAVISHRLQCMNVTALLLVPILDDAGRYCGSIGFSEKTGPREWRKSEVDSCRFLARLISISYMRRLALQRLEHLNEINNMLFDKVEAKGYVIDDSFQILRGNECLSAAIPIQRGQKCYAVLQNRRSPCAACPVRMLNKSRQYASAQLFIFAWNKECTVSASSMSWVDNRKAYLITCNELSCNELSSDDLSSRSSS